MTERTKLIVLSPIVAFFALILLVSIGQQVRYIDLPEPDPGEYVDPSVPRTLSRVAVPKEIQKMTDLVDNAAGDLYSMPSPRFHEIERKVKKGGCFFADSPNLSSHVEVSKELDLMQAPHREVTECGVAQVP